MNLKSEKGFALIEALVAVMIISGALLSIVTLANRSLNFSRNTLKSYQATLATEEAVEAVKSIRRESWDDNIAVLTIGTNYGIQLGATNWEIVAAPQTNNLGFTRTIVFNQGYRDANDDIADSGTADPNLRKVTVTTSWSDAGVSKSQDIEFYIADIF